MNQSINTIKNKYQVYLMIFAFLLTMSCTKEGLVGPQGPQGPSGESGAGSGASLGIITYEISSNFSWEQTSSNATGKSYRLKYTTPTRSGSTFNLPDSVTRYIEEGSLLVYGYIDEYEGNKTAMGWCQLADMPAQFYTRAAYTYTVQKTSTGYQVTIIAMNVPNLARDCYDLVRFVIIPKTTSGTLEGN